jgi:hypothetical protein
VIAVDDGPSFIHGQKSIGVAIESQTNLGAGLDHPTLQILRMGGAATIVDVVTVGGRVENVEFDTESGQLEP